MRANRKMFLRIFLHIYEEIFKNLQLVGKHTNMQGDEPPSYTKVQVLPTVTVYLLFFPSRNSLFAGREG